MELCPPPPPLPTFTPSLPSPPSPPSLPPLPPLPPPSPHHSHLVFANTYVQYTNYWHNCVWSLRHGFHIVPNTVSMTIVHVVVDYVGTEICLSCTVG